MDRIDTNRNRIVTVMKRPLLREEEISEYTFADEFGNKHTTTRLIWGDFERVQMTYADLCHDLGIDPDVNFVAITKAGSITWTAGKPEEIHALYRAIEEKGYKSKSSKNRKEN